MITMKIYDFFLNSKYALENGAVFFLRFTPFLYFATWEVF